MLGAAARQTSTRCGSGPALGYCPGWCPGRIERSVHEHRQRVLPLAGRGDGLRVAREVPRHEGLLPGRPGAEHLRPGAARLTPGPEPQRPQLRGELVPVGGERGQELGGHRRAEGAIGLGAVVARGRDHPDLVLDLDHQHGAGCLVDLAQVPQERGEGPGIGIAVRRREGRQDLLRRAALVGRAREPLRVALHPGGRVAGHAVLPRPEPQQHEPHPVAARVGEELVEAREVEAAFFRLDELPVDGSEHRVHVELGELRPERPEIGGVGGGGVAELAAADQERLPVHDQLDGAALATQVRQRRAGGRGWSGRRSEDAQQDRKEHLFLRGCIIECGLLSKGKSIHEIGSGPDDGPAVRVHSRRRGRSALAALPGDLARRPHDRIHLQGRHLLRPRFRGRGHAADDQRGVRFRAGLEPRRQEHRFRIGPLRQLRRLRDALDWRRGAAPDVPLERRDAFDLHGRRHRGPLRRLQAGRGHERPVPHSPDERALPGPGRRRPRHAGAAGAGPGRHGRFHRRPADLPRHQGLRKRLAQAPHLGRHARRLDVRLQDQDLQAAHAIRRRGPQPGLRLGRRRVLLPERAERLVQRLPELAVQSFAEHGAHATSRGTRCAS